MSKKERYLNCKYLDAGMDGMLCSRDLCTTCKEFKGEKCSYYMPKNKSKDKEKQIILTEEELKKIIQEEYQNALKGKVVLSKEEYNALIAEYKAITYKYDDICDRYRLCKDANETIKQHVVMTRKETAEKILDQIKFLVEERNGADLEDLSVDGTILEEILVELAKQFGVDIKE